MSLYGSIQITALTPAESVQGTDVFPGVDTLDETQSPSGTTKKFTITQLQEFLVNEFSGDNIQSAVCVETSNLTAVYFNGDSDDGVGATLTNTGALGQLVIDGYITIAGDRVLIAGQTMSFENGVYEVTDAGDVGTPWVLTRVADFNGSTLGQIIQGRFIYIVFGNNNALTSWVLTSDSYPVVGSEPIIFEKQVIPAADPWVVTGSNTVMTNNTGYTVTGNAQFALPVFSTPGEWVELNCAGGLFTITQNTGQTIYYGGVATTTTGTSGSVVALLGRSSIRLRCTQTNTAFDVVAASGSFNFI